MEEKPKDKIKIPLFSFLILLLLLILYDQIQTKSPAAWAESKAGIPSNLSEYYPPPRFTFTAVGDIMLDRGVGSRIKKYRPDYPFAHVAGLLKNADLTFGNLESMISKTGKKTLGKEVTFRADIDSVAGLSFAGIDIVSLANNHAIDFGDAALIETMDILAHNRIAYIGAGANFAAAHRPARFNINTIEIAFLAYSYEFDKVKEASESPGIAVIDAEQVKQDIISCRRWADIVIISCHWGWEYSDHPDNETREFAQAAIDSGADLLIGHHPHVIQGVEKYKKGLICYSLGNFVFDQIGSRVKRGLILKCTLGKSGLLRATLLPIIIDQSEFRPRPAPEKEAFSILEELKKLSFDLNTVIEVENNQAEVKLTDSN
jgi:poly-gamma-glutamate capsule biosynthesis protein CapA/YwtB (metallophosphatase superfamily)